MHPSAGRVRVVEGLAPVNRGEGDRAEDPEPRLGGAVGCHQVVAPRLECGVRVTAVRVRLWGSPANERQDEPLKPQNSD